MMVSLSCSVRGEGSYEKKTNWGLHTCSTPPSYIMRVEVPRILRPACDIHLPPSPTFRIEFRGHETARKMLALLKFLKKALDAWVTV